MTAEIIQFDPFAKRVQRDAALDAARRSQSGFFAGLTAEQQKAALEYRGEDTICFAKDGEPKVPV